MSRSCPRPLGGIIKIPEGQSDFLNYSRWVAAWLVVASHLRGICLMDYSAKIGNNPFLQGFYFLTGFGHQAVIVFFVISGFLVGGKVLQLQIHDKFCWKEYLADRFSRIYPAYFGALLLVALLDSVASKYLNAAGLYDLGFGAPIPTIPFNFSERLNLASFLGNTVFLQTIYFPVFGSNSPLWSLAYEWWYYLLFPLLCLVFLAPRKMGKVTALLLCVVILGVLTADILWLGIYWLAGAALSKINQAVATLPAWISLLAALIYSRTQESTVPRLEDSLIALAYCLVLNSAKGWDRRLPFSRMAEWGASFSYSVYLVHFPIILFTVSLLYQATGWGMRMNPSGPIIALWGVLFGALIGICWLFYNLTEKKTAQLRIWLKRSKYR
jgi:peptidoglycan/LPS O-acetylase OafA/YrhL